MSRLRFLPGRGIIAMATIILFAAGAASAAEPLEKAGFHRLLQRQWKDVELSRDFEYWRAPEMTPGALVCAKPAATDVWVSCDRWPDGSDVRRFGLDAIRLSGAKTDHEKAMAVYRWVRRWMIFTGNGKGAPAERLTPRLRKHPCIHEPVKLPNVYGAHWCGGQARVVEMVWRSLGYRAEKVCRGGHTIVGMHYRDYDKRVVWSTGKDRKNEGWGRPRSWCVGGTIRTWPAITGRSSITPLCRWECSATRASRRGCASGSRSSSTRIFALTPPRLWDTSGTKIRSRPSKLR